MSLILPQTFYESNDVTQIARELLGKIIVSKTAEGYSSALITETEAYCGASDKACHAYAGRRTKRTELIFGPPGYAYVYLCYGIHQLFNIVTNRESMADAVLIRAAEPLEGTDLMMKRRGLKKLEKRLTIGPGNFSKALGIWKEDYGLPLFTGEKFWLEDRGVQVKNILASPRVGIDYAEEDALLPWRFRIKGNAWAGK